MSRRIPMTFRAPQYIIRDNFTDSVAAPLPSTRICVPGPGQLTITDTGNNLSISGDKLQIGGGASVWGNPGGYGAAMSRVAGRALLARFEKTATTTFGLALGWINNTRNDSDSGDYNEGFIAFRNAASIMTRFNTTYVTHGVYAANTTYQVAVVLRTVGYFVLIKGGVFSNWTLIWVANNGNTATLRPAFANYNAVGTLDDLQVVDLPGPWASDYGIALYRGLNPSISTNVSVPIDHVTEFTFTHGSASNTDILFRYVDTNNFYKIICRSTDGLIAITRTVAGVQNTLVQSSAGITTGATYRVVLTVEGSIFKAYLNNLLQLSITDGTYLSATQMQVLGPTSPSELVVWPRTIAIPG